MFLTTLLFLAVDTLVPPAWQKQVTVRPQTGFIIPHADDLRAVSASRPVGLTLEYSRTALSQAAFARSNCFARVGTYLTYTTFNNPAELGESVGTGAFFEPMIRAGKPLFFSVRTTAGLVLLSRVYDPVSNPRNTFFSTPLSGFLGISFSTHYRVGHRLEASLMASYNHISNGGTRLPNRGMNYPMLGLGITYYTHHAEFPDTRLWPEPPLTARHLTRLVGFGSIRTVLGEAALPTQLTWLLGFTGTYAYCLSRFHALGAGLEVVQDGYLREVLRRSGLPGSAWQVAPLAGYELGLGRYTFATYLGYVLNQPASQPGSPLFQRYQLLYNLPGGAVLGVGLKARLQVAEGFDIRVGWRFQR